MHRPIVLAALFGVVLAAPATAGPRVTIYTHDLAYVQEPRTLTLGGGRDTVRISDIPDRIDFPSVRLDTGDRARTERLAYRYDLASGDGLLERSLGRRVRVTSQHGDRVSEGVLAASDGSWLVLRMEDGSVVNVARGDVAEVRLADAGKGLSLRPSLEVVLASERKGDVPATLSFLTGGLSWSAEHRLTRTGETTGRWATTVTIENTSGRDYRDATLRLVAGEPRRAVPGPEPRAMVMGAMAMSERAVAKADLSEQGFSEYHLYRLDHPALVRDRESQSLVMLTERNVKIEPRYLVRQGLPGVLAQVRLVNDETSGLGVPLPAGRVRVFEPDGGGGDAFTGESTIGH
ncbi:MAG TPA: hypothetical protein VLV15_13250, partial [Dongiaceae bacterium]|nr:hypothetical protein [Dongiaceae bacterium]